MEETVTLNRNLRLSLSLQQMPYPTAGTIVAGIRSLALPASPPEGGTAPSSVEVQRARVSGWR